MEWWEQLGKDNKGSRPRCVLLIDGSRCEVAQRLTGLINMPDVAVNPTDQWIPWDKPIHVNNGKWDKSPANEAELHKAGSLLPSDIRVQLKDWWLAVAKNARTPNWDIASTCSINGEPGLLLIEAKAHAAELAPKLDKCSSTNRDNRLRISEAIKQANGSLNIATEGTWNLSRDHHYQLSNRFAWAWKLASLGVPVILIYLGFLGAQDMIGRELFHCSDDWEKCVKEYGKGVVDNDCWGRRLNIQGTPIFPLIRVYNQPFHP